MQNWSIEGMLEDKLLGKKAKASEKFVFFLKRRVKYYKSPQNQKFKNEIYLQ